MARSKKESEKDISSNPFLKYFHMRVKRNKNCLCAMVGYTGSGKSYGVLKLAESLDPNFNIDRVAFTAEDFHALLKRDDLPAGSVIIFDESGVALQARQFMSVFNRLISHALQVIRFKNHIIFFTVPDISFIDAQARKLLHMILITEKVLYSQNRVRVRPYVVSINHLRGDKNVYHVNPRIREGTDIIKITRITLGLPSLKLRRQYEDKKLKYVNDDLLASSEVEIQKLKHNKAKDVLTEQEKLVYKLDQANLSTDEIARILKIKGQSVRDLRSRYKKALRV